MTHALIWQERFQVMGIEMTKCMKKSMSAQSSYAKLLSTLLIMLKLWFWMMDVSQFTSITNNKNKYIENVKH